MPRPDLSKMQKGELLQCPWCIKPVSVATVHDWFVYYCPACEHQWEQADCFRVTITMHARPPNKGGTRYEEDPLTGDHP